MFLLCPLPVLVCKRETSHSGRVEIGRPDTEREIEVAPLEEPLPAPAPAVEPQREPDRAPA